MSEPTVASYAEIAQNLTLWIEKLSLARRIGRWNVVKEVEEAMIHAVRIRP